MQSKAYRAEGASYFAQARRYDASIGRFVSEDKLKGAQILPISMNLYAYCLNRPQDLLDIDGNSPRAGITKICEGYLGSAIKSDNVCPFEESWNTIKHDATDVFNHIKSGASKAWDSFKDWAQSDTGKVVLTTAAIVGVAAVGVFVGGSVGIGLLGMAGISAADPLPYALTNFFVEEISFSTGNIVSILND